MATNIWIMSLNLYICVDGACSGSPVLVHFHVRSLNNLNVYILEKLELVFIGKLRKWK